MSKKLPKQISERLRKLMTGYELPHGTEFKDLEAFLAEELANQKKEMIERIKKMKKEIRYEELDTGIGIDKLEYDGQEEEHAFNRILDDIIKAIK